MSAVIVSAEKRAKIKKFSLPPFVHFNVHTGKHFSALQELLQIHNPHGSELERERGMETGEWEEQTTEEKVYFFIFIPTHSLTRCFHLHTSIYVYPGARASNERLKIFMEKNGSCLSFYALLVADKGLRTSKVIRKVLKITVQCICFWDASL